MSSSLPGPVSSCAEVAYPLVNAGKDVLIVGHGAMDSSIVCQVRNIPIADFWSAGIVNCKLMKLM